MKLNPLPWISNWLSQPDDFWKSMNHWIETVEANGHEEAKVKENNEEFNAALALAEDLFRIKS